MPAPVLQHSFSSQCPEMIHGGVLADAYTHTQLSCAGHASFLFLEGGEPLEDFGLAGGEGHRLNLKMISGTSREDVITCHQPMKNKAAFRLSCFGKSVSKYKER